MKNFYLLLAALLFCIQLSLAQSFIPFQGIARDTAGNLLANQSLGLRISIHDSIATGPVVYQENQSATTNNFGLFTLSIGTGSLTLHSFDSINWSHNPKFVQLELNVIGAIYTTLGTSQLGSVPYALYALSGGGGSSAQPIGQIPYGNGRGIISDPGFVRDSATGEVDLFIMTPANGGTYFKADSDGVLIIHQNSTQNKMALFGIGNPHNMVPQLDTLMVVAGIVDNDSNVIYGFYAHADSTELITGQVGNDHGPTNGNYGLVGCSRSSSYLDATYNNGASLNSLTLDSFGVHFEYAGTDVYTFPLTAGTSGQVLGTNGSGILTWVNSPTAGKGVFTPSSGDSISAVWGSNIINPSTGLGILTITLPSSPNDNETVYFTFTHTITAVYFSGGTVVAPITGISSVSAGSFKYWLTYDAGSSSWY